MKRRLLVLRSLLVAILAVGTGMALTVGLVLGERWSQLGPLLVYLAAGAVGVLIVQAQSHNPIGWMLLAAGCGLAVADAGAFLARAEVHGGVWVAWASAPARPVAILMLLVLVPMHFPDGLLPGRAWRGLRHAVIVLMGASGFYAAVRPGPLQVAAVANPLGWSGLAPFTPALEVLLLAGSLGAFAVGAASLINRYRGAGRTQRGQIKWLAYAVAGFLLLAVVGLALQARSSMAFPVVEGGLVAAALGVPAAIGIATIRHNLYDIDRVISRTLVYATLTVTVVALYVIIVGYLGLAFQARGSLGVSLVATGIVAVAFSPIRERLQRAVNRLVYGDRDDPYSAVSRLGRRLDQATSPEALLVLAAAEIADALRLSYVAIEVTTPAGAEVVASSGVPPEPDRIVRLPLKVPDATVGWLTLGVRDPDGLSVADRQLLGDLVRPIGATVHAHRLATELGSARERLVEAREEERGRLHRDLHDGLGPELATLSMLGEAARDALHVDPQEAASLLNDLVERAQHAVDDLRHVVYGLRPAVLDVLGLVEGLRAFAAAHGGHGLTITVDGVEPEPRLPPAVEVAAYRIALEALTNASRHAGANHCTVRLSVLPQRLQLDILDDGRGISPDDQPGVGLRSMRQRATELGGGCTIAARSQGGTRVTVVLPLARSPKQPTRAVAATRM